MINSENVAVNKSLEQKASCDIITRNIFLTLFVKKFRTPLSLALSHFTYNALILARFFQKFYTDKGRIFKKLILGKLILDPDIFVRCQSKGCMSPA